MSLIPNNCYRLGHQLNFCKNFLGLLNKIGQDLVLLVGECVGGILGGIVEEDTRWKVAYGRLH